jgi:hypothetical protein
MRVELLLTVISLIWWPCLLHGFYFRVPFKPTLFGRLPDRVGSKPLNQYKQADNTNDFNDDSLNAIEIDQAMKDTAPLWNSIRTNLTSEEEDFTSRFIQSSERVTNPIVGGNNSLDESKEKIFREYQFHHLQLPVLDDAHNYYCGSYKNCFWHQNADQVLVYIPIPDSLCKNKVNGRFEVNKVTINCGEEELISFHCPERIIPDGCCWVFERDFCGKRFLQVDLEKRFRMINWGSLFGEQSSVVSSFEESSSKSKLLEKLLEANQGMSKVTGLPPETMAQMMKDERLLNSIGKLENTGALFEAGDGSNSDADGSQIPIPELVSREDSIMDLLENRSIYDRLNLMNSELTDKEFENGDTCDKAIKLESDSVLDVDWSDALL